jgi:hypothetical protein
LSATAIASLRRAALCGWFFGSPSFIAMSSPSSLTVLRARMRALVERVMAARAARLPAVRRSASMAAGASGSR